MNYSPSNAMLIALANDLVCLHNDEKINLDFFPSAREIVTHYYEGNLAVRHLGRGIEWNGEISE